MQFVICVDYGTLSVRVIIVDAESGNPLCFYAVSRFIEAGDRLTMRLTGSDVLSSCMAGCKGGFRGSTCLIHKTLSNYFKGERICLKKLKNFL